MKTIGIGFGHEGLISKDDEYTNVELYYGSVEIKNDIIPLMYNNWGDDSILNAIDSSEVLIWYEDDILFFEDRDSYGGGFSCDKQTFIELFS